MALNNEERVTTMPLPPYIAPGLYINGLGITTATARPEEGQIPSIFGLGVSCLSRLYNWTYDGGAGPGKPSMTISNTDPRNLLYVGNQEKGVAIGILENVQNEMHVISDNFSGCEFHVLGRKGGSAAAFLHVYKSGGLVIPYGQHGDWELKATLESSGLIASNNYVHAYAYVNAGTAVCCMLLLREGKVVGRVETKEFQLA
jgi:hypothetical protein